MKNKKIIFVFLAQKKHFLKLCIWSVRSLQKFYKSEILIIVDKLEEKKFLNKYLDNISIKILKVDLGGLNMWCWKPLLLKKLNLDYDQIIVSDVDIIWHKDPKFFLERIGNKTWFHKITKLDPKEIVDNLGNDRIPKRRIGLINMIRYFNSNKIKNLPNYQVNGGLFSVSKLNFPIIANEWFKAINSMNYPVIMTEAIMSIVLANKKISPYCDIEDIKYHNKIATNKTSYNVAEYKILEKSKKSNFNGYQYATHYHGDQRLSMAIKAKKIGLDKNNFFISIICQIFFAKIKRITDKII